MQRISPRALTFVLVVSGVIAGGPRQAPPPAGNAFKVIGYYAEWTSDRYPLADIPADELTHVNYAFAKIGPDNRLQWNTRLFDQIALLKQKHPRLKFIMSVGGWTDSAPFYDTAASEANRHSFAESCAAFLHTYPQFYGIDIVWRCYVVV